VGLNNIDGTGMVHDEDGAQVGLMVVVRDVDEIEAVNAEAVA
jgi:hypothetical protein